MRSFAEWAHRISPEPTEFNASAAKNGLSDKYYERLHALKPGEILIPLNSLKKPGLFTVVNEAALLVVGDRSVKPHDGTRGLIYAATTGRRSTDGPFRNRTILLHRLLVFGFEGFETAKPFVVHHKDGNTLNNVWDNLQITTQTYNQEVAERVAGNSGFKGVRFETKRTLSRPHRVEIVVGNFKFDQRFSCPIEAAVVHDETLIDLCVVQGLLHPDRVFVRLNFETSKQKLRLKVRELEQAEQEDLARAMTAYRQRVASIEVAWIEYKKEQALLNEEIPF